MKGNVPRTPRNREPGDLLTKKKVPMKNFVLALTFVLFASVSFAFDNTEPQVVETFTNTSYSWTNVQNKVYIGTIIAAVGTHETVANTAAVYLVKSTDAGNVTITLGSGGSADFEHYIYSAPEVIEISRGDIITVTMDAATNSVIIMKNYVGD